MAKLGGIVMAYCILMAGCDSGVSGQIEKCVQIGLQAKGPYKTDQEKTEAEFAIRGYCLNAAAGKT